MLNELWTDWLRRVGGRPAFRIYGKAKPETDWRIIDIYATPRRDLGSGWPLWDGTCVTWSAHIIAVGWDFALAVLCEQAENPASRQHPIEVTGGRIRDPSGRKAWGMRRGAWGERKESDLLLPHPTPHAPRLTPTSEILAHECGHTWQALRLHDLYLPFVGMVTLFREGPHPWNHFENQASELGQFGGIVAGSVVPELLKSLKQTFNRGEIRD